MIIAAARPAVASGPTCPGRPCPAALATVTVASVWELATEVASASASASSTLTKVRVELAVLLSHQVSVCWLTSSYCGNLNLT
jgi:hypothetical protein